MNIERVIPESVPLKGAGDLRLAIVLWPGLATGLLANTAATIAAGLGAAQPGLGNVTLRDRDGLSTTNSADRPIPILQADPADMRAILEKIHKTPEGLTVVVFPEFARRLHSFVEYEAEMQKRALSEGPLDGIGLCGPAQRVKSLTGALKLLR